MKNRVLFPLAAVFLAQSCLTGTDVKVENLQGSWVATHIAYANVNDDTDVADLFALGVRASMDIGPAGAFTLALDIPGEGVDVQNGEMTTDNNNVVWVIGTDTIPGEVFLQDDQVSFQMLSGATRDFNGDGQLDEARINLVLNRLSS